MGPLFFLVIWTTAIAIGFDAHSLRYPAKRTPGSQGGPVAWFFLVLLLWIIAVPLYISKRPMLKEAGARARRGEWIYSEETPLPRESSLIFFASLFGCAIGALVLAGIGSVVAASSAGSSSPTSLAPSRTNLPECDSPAVTKLAEALIAKSDFVSVGSVALTLPREKAYDSVTPNRTCRATAHSRVGVETVDYSVEWDEVSGKFWVEVHTRSASR